MVKINGKQHITKAGVIKKNPKKQRKINIYYSILGKKSSEARSMFLALKQFGLEIHDENRDYDDEDNDYDDEDNEYFMRVVGDIDDEDVPKIRNIFNRFKALNFELHDEGDRDSNNNFNLN